MLQDGVLVVAATFSFFEDSVWFVCSGPVAGSRTPSGVLDSEVNDVLARSSGFHETLEGVVEGRLRVEGPVDRSDFENVQGDPGLPGSFDLFHEISQPKLAVCVSTSSVGLQVRHRKADKAAPNHPEIDHDADGVPIDEETFSFGGHAE